MRRPDRAKITVEQDVRGAPARLKVPTAWVRRLAAEALRVEGIVRGELSVVVTRDPRIRALNAEFRAKDKVTNVLSFPQDDPRAGGLIGDVAISVDTVARQGAQTGSGFRYTFAFYLVHGILHLLGHDHHEPAEAKRMYRRTREILETVGVDAPKRSRKRRETRRRALS